MIRSGFFNSVGGDRKYNAEDFSNYFEKIVSDGVFANPSTNLQVTANSGMILQVNAGSALVKSKWIKNDGYAFIVLDQANSTLARIDSIVLTCYLGTSGRQIKIEKLTGTASQTPVAPTLTRSSEKWQLRLANIAVAAGATSITNANITDTRANTAECGWVTGLIDQVDTSTLYKQWQSAYEQYYNDTVTKTEGFKTSYFNDLEKFKTTQEKLFNEWLIQLTDTLTVSSVVKEYTSQKVSTANQSLFAIDIPSYNVEKDIINVYVNGMKLIRDVEYVYDQVNIKLATGLDADQDVEIVVEKSVDGFKADSVIDQVADVQADVEKIKKYVYFATGKDDNIALTNLAKNFYNSTDIFAGNDKNSEIKIEVLGDLGVTTPAGGSGTADDPYYFFDFGKPDGSTKKLTVDLTNTARMNLQGQTAKQTVIFNGNDYTIYNAKAALTVGSSLIAFKGDNLRIHNAEIYLNGTDASVVTGLIGYGSIYRSRFSCTSGDARVVGIIVNNNGFIRVVDCELLSYNQTTSSYESIGILVETNQTESVLIAERNNIPLRNRNGYKQSQTIKVNSGYASLVSNILGKEPALYSTTNCSNIGSMIIPK